MFGAATSLLFNVVGSALVEQHPLRLIQVYLTFPLGERALELDGGLALTIGCCLYIGTGMLLGVLFHILLARGTANSSLGVRLGIATLLAGAMWFVHFYLILAWLQPVLFGGNWIVDLIPWWIGLLTHLIYGWDDGAALPAGRVRSLPSPDGSGRSKLESPASSTFSVVTLSQHSTQTETT